MAHFPIISPQSRLDQEIDYRLQTMASTMDDTLCKYPSRSCQNPRSLKISGELHRFCITHRRKANAAQRRWTLKRRADTDEENRVNGSRKRVREYSETASSDEEGSAWTRPTKVPRVDVPLFDSLPELQATPTTVDAGEGDWQAPVLSDAEFTQLCASFLATEENRIAPPLYTDNWWDPNYAGFTVFHPQETTTVTPTQWQF